MSEHRRERGTTILIVAAGMISMLAMLALAIDVVSLYVAEGDAQRAADAAALAGAKVFVSSGFTSGQLGDPTSGTAQDLVCNGSTGLADLEAQTVANSNPIAGVAATTITTSCTWATSNPQITVTVQRTGLPTLFARIWGARIVSVTRSAKAEAYNPSGKSVPIQVHSVKPWLIPNCDPAHTTPTNPNCTPAAAYLFDPATNYGIANLINGSVAIPLLASPFPVTSRLATLQRLRRARRPSSRTTRQIYLSPHPPPTALLRTLCRVAQSAVEVLKRITSIILRAVGRFSSPPASRSAPASRSQWTRHRG